MSAIVRSAGAVVLKPTPTPSVLVVHRPHYNDWTLPKGKRKRNEFLSVTAVREVREETGVSVRLGLPLDRTKYTLPSGEHKSVDWWLGVVVDEGTFVANDEVDQCRWVPVDEALTLLTHPMEHDVLRQAAAQPATQTLIIVRHGKAHDRKGWDDEDRTRPLVARGRTQAETLLPVFAAYGIQRVVSSPAYRCVDTVALAAQQAHVPVEPVAELSEEDGAEHPEEVIALMEVLAEQADGHPTLVCGHRPLLALMQETIGLHAIKLGTGDLVIGHLADGDAVAYEHIENPH